MDRKSLEQLRLDRRLTSRRGWLAKEELDRELEALPDAAESATPLGEANDSEESSPAPDDGDTAQG